MTNIEEALALLAAPATDAHFLTRALRALALITQCRWAGFGRIKDQHTGELVAFVDNRQALPTMEFPLAGSPCGSVYQLAEGVQHVLYAKELQKHFPQFEFIKTLGAESYQAEIVRDRRGKLIGHIFVLDTLPQSETVKSREFFRILAQRIATEQHRTLQQQELTLLQQLLNDGEQAVAHLDLKLRFTATSSAFTRLTNPKQLPQVGMSLFEGFPQFAQIATTLTAVLAGDIPAARWHQLMPSNNTGIQFTFRASHDHAGETTGLLLSALPQAEPSADSMALFASAS